MYLVYGYLALLLFYAPLVLIQSWRNVKKELVKRRQSIGLGLQVIAFILTFVIGLTIVPFSVIFLPYIRQVKQLMGKLDE
jgi:Sec-independent protein secretion pathway component TatC